MLKHRVDGYTEDNQLFGSLQRMGFFINKTRVSIYQEEYTFDYAASFFDNVVVKDINGKK